MLQRKIRERLPLFERNTNDFLERVPFPLDSQRTMEEFLRNRAPGQKEYLRQREECVEQDTSTGGELT